MSRRAFERLLIHRCTFIKKGVIIGKDAYNRNIYGDLPVHNVPCRFDTIRKRVVSNDKSVDIVEQNVLFVIPLQHISDSMQVSNIKTPDGITIVSGVFGIEGKNPQYSRKRLHHFEFELKKVHTNG
ncbi:hypothetical protein P4U07_27760 [Bacillus mycoides]|uniref:hypothetical protein n=1 Tax=Bacillus mycoides TaxID=1405 RepID=UPI002E2224BE|nr:hypothetical protein [Bacillus mycoides]